MARHFKEVLIFGAGASYGSCNERLPPLTKDLINELIEFDPTGWGYIPSEYQKLFYEDFEKGFFQFTKKFPDTLGPLQRAMACYFFTFTPNQTNLFMELARRIRERNWQNPVVTLNYDRFLESSLLANNIKPIPPGINSKLREDDFILPVCYPHGCCNLFYRSERINFKSGPIDFKIIKNTEFFHSATISGSDVYFSNNLNEFQEKIMKTSFPPIMSYVVPTKSTNVGKEFLKLQQEKFKLIIEEASKIGIVGLRIRPYDKHIWNPLAKTNAKIIYCSGTTSTIEYKKWASLNRKSWKEDVILNFNWVDCFNEFCSYFDLDCEREPVEQKNTFSQGNNDFNLMKKFVRNFGKE